MPAPLPFTNNSSFQTPIVSGLDNFINKTNHYKNMQSEVNESGGYINSKKVLIPAVVE